MKLTDEEIIKLIPEPTRYFGHSKMSPMYTKEEIVDFAKALEAKILDVDMEPVAWMVTCLDGEQDGMTHPTPWLRKFGETDGGHKWQNEPLYTAAQLAAHAEKARKDAITDLLNGVTDDRRKGGTWAGTERRK